MGCRVPGVKVGRLPDIDRYKRILKWEAEGRSRPWVAKQLGISRSAARQLSIRAHHWELAEERERLLRNPDAETAARVQLSISQDHVLARIDEIITDGLKVQAAVTRPVLEDLRRELPDLKRAIGTLMERMVILEAAIEQIPSAQVVTTQASDAQAAKGVPPPSLWVWLAQECARELTRTGVAEWLGVEPETVESWIRGKVPSSRQRDDLRALAATIWARQLFADVDDLLDARDRLPTAQNVGAT